MAGYSATPLWKKLGYKPGISAYVHRAPENYGAALVLPAAVPVTWLKRPERGVAFIHAFVRDLAELKKLVAEYRELLAPDGAIWIPWPKKAAKIPTDVTEDRIREVALPLGLVDIKVCAVDEIWSGLKLVVRKALR